MESQWTTKPHRAGTGRQRIFAAVGLLVGILCAVRAVPKLEQAREQRLLEESGAQLKVGIDNQTVVAAEFTDSKISMSVARKLAELDGLERLTFCDCQIAAGVFPILESIAGLGELELRGSRWDSSKELQAFLATVQLKMGDFSRTDFGHSEAAMIDTSRLVAITLTDCHSLTQDDVVTLAAADRLKHLSCKGVSLSRAVCHQIKQRQTGLLLSVAPEDLIELKPLVAAGARLHLDEWFHVVGLSLHTDSSALLPAELDQLEHLQWMEVKHTIASDELLEAVCRHDQLEVLSLEGSYVSAQALHRLGRLSKLRTLNLDGVVTRDGVDLQLPKLQGLQYCRANTTAVSDRTLKHLDLPALEFLSVGGHVTPSGLANLTHLENLHAVFLCETLIDREFCEFLKSFDRLDYLRLYHCGVHEQDLGDVLVASNIETLHLIDPDTPQLSITAWRQRAPELKLVHWRL